MGGETAVVDRGDFGKCEEGEGEEEEKEKESEVKEESST